MSTVKNGDIVKVNYTGRLDDGTVFDTSENKEPLQFEMGLGRVIPGFEDAIMGMLIGDKKTVTIPADQAYGEYREDFKQDFPRDQFPTYIKLEVGQHFKIDQKEGGKVLVRIAALSDTTITLDANNPLAGKDLTFDIELLEIT
jgi:peptidylprolyl isomerase